MKFFLEEFSQGRLKIFPSLEFPPMDFITEESRLATEAILNMQKIRQAGHICHMLTHATGCGYLYIEVLMDTQQQVDDKSRQISQ